MATLIQALAALGPKLVYGRRIELDELAEWIAGRSGQSPPGVEQVLNELQAAIMHFACVGQPVRAPGLGRVRPSIGRDGQIRLHITPDPRVVAAINRQGAYRGKIQNRTRIGLDNAGYKALWDAAHPDDTLALPRRGLSSGR